MDRIPLFGDLQSSWLLLVHCAAARANYMSRVVEPDAAPEFCRRHDAAVWRCFCTFTKIEESQPRDERHSLHASGVGRTRAEEVRVARASPAYWASWADCLSMVQRRHPHVAAALVTEVEGSPTWKGPTLANPVLAIQFGPIQFGPIHFGPSLFFSPGQFWPKPILAKPFLDLVCHGPEGWGPNPERWGPEGWSRRVEGPKFRAFFLLSHHQFCSFSLTVCLLVVFWWCLEAPGPSRNFGRSGGGGSGRGGSGGGGSGGGGSAGRGPGGGGPAQGGQTNNHTTNTTTNNKQQRTPHEPQQQNDKQPHPTTTIHNNNNTTQTKLDWPKLGWPNGLAKNGLAQIGLAKVGHYRPASPSLQARLPVQSRVDGKDGVRATVMGRPCTWRATSMDGSLKTGHAHRG